MSSIKILSFFQIIKMDFQSCALYMSWNGPSVWVLTICAILFVYEISAMLFSLNLFLLCFSHYTRAYLWLHHFWSGSSLGMSQSFDGVHPIIEWELAIYHLINCINSIPRVLSKPLVTPSQKGIWNWYQNKMWIIVLWHSMDY
jgi:hypothetical protein